MSPKAIIKFPKRVKKEKDSKYPSTLDRLTYCFLEKKDGPESKVERDIPDRVLWIEGELGDLGFPVRDAASMAQAIDFGHGSKKGRKSRGLVLSCRELSPEEEHLRAGIFQSMRDSLVALAERLGTNRWLAIAHDDKFHPHIHFIYRNWDEENNRTLDLRPHQLKDLQSMDWTESLETGRGSREGKVKGPRTKRDMELLEYATGNTPLQRALAEQKSAPIQALRKFLNEQKTPKMESPQDLADFLFSHLSLPSTWDTSKLKTKKGGARTNPAIIIDNVGLKLRRFFEFLCIDKSREKTVGKRVAKKLPGEVGPKIG